MQNAFMRSRQEINNNMKALMISTTDIRRLTAMQRSPASSARIKLSERELCHRSKTFDELLNRLGDNITANQIEKRKYNKAHIPPISEASLTGTPHIDVGTDSQDCQIGNRPGGHLCLGLKRVSF